MLDVGSSENALRPGCLTSQLSIYVKAPAGRYSGYFGVQSLA